jgi:hypothetical protein
MTILETFFLLQLLDYMSTLIGLQMGGTELSPFASWLISLDPVGGLTAVKLIGFSLGGYCVWSNRIRVIAWFNYISAVIVVWNLLNIMKGVNMLTS